MLDVKRIVRDKEKVKVALLKRLNENDFDLDKIERVYLEYKKKLENFESKRAEQKKFNDEMSSLEKGSDAFKKKIKELKVFADEVKKFEEEANKLKSELDVLVEVLPNIPDDDVPAGGKENNKVVREYGDPPQFDFEIKDHVDIATNLGMIDFERAVKIAGAQFAMYTGDGAVLEWALLNFFIREHLDDGYAMVLPPHLVTEESAYTAGQLPKFRDDVYWTQDKTCLIPTAETALANYYRNEILEEKELPKKLFAYSPCYRREAGGYRTNERGLLRMHQFNKVEMFQYTTEETSNDALEELLVKATKIVEKLGLHYRVTLLAAEDCSNVAAKTYDVEVLHPISGKYHEVSSLSNVRDYYARRGMMRYRTKAGDIKYIHMLNASGLATSRLMAVLLETYQNSDGSFTVPDVLQEYVGKSKITAA